jgi:hypothetical protein
MAEIREEFDAQSFGRPTSSAAPSRGIESSSEPAFILRVAFRIFAE